MGYAKLQLNLQRLLTLEQARDYMGYPVIFDKMRKQGWIKPVVQNAKLIAFDIKHLDQCADRLGAGESLDL